MNQLSPEVIEAVRNALFEWHYGSRSDAQELYNDEDLMEYLANEARAALTAAGVAAVERDSNLVAEAVPDLGNTITGGAE